MSKTIHVTATFEATYEIEVPDDWQYEGIESITEHDELSTAGASMIDWEVSE
jgi:hypothetical protein